MAWALSRHLSLTGPLICENGGVVWDWRRGESKFTILADGTRARLACEWLATRISGLDSGGISSNAWRESEWCLYTHEDNEAIERELSQSEWKDLEVVRTGFAIHVNDPGMNKGAGIRLALEPLGIAPSDCIGVGDSPNDLPMFSTIGWAVAVGSAFPK